MKKLTLITGGARSGKSHYAENLLANKESVTYVATAPSYSRDAEWSARIYEHQIRRPNHWKTIETLDLPMHLATFTEKDFILIDCLTLWLTSTIDAMGGWTTKPGTSEFKTFTEQLEEEINSLCVSLKKCLATVVVVTNEVGSGIVPDTVSGRIFQDLQGKLNVRVGNVCDRVVLVVAGRALDIS